MTKNVTCFIFSLQALDLEALVTQLVASSGETESFDSGLEVRAIHTIASEDLAFYRSAAALSLNIPTNTPDSDIKVTVEHLSQIVKFDYCLLSSPEQVTAIKLAVFDMDSTLIPMEVIDELAAEAGVKEEVAAITEQAMQGDLDFNQSFKKRLSLLRGMSKQAVGEVKSRLTFNAGVEQLIAHLVDHGAVVGIASGGFEPFAKALAELAPITKIRSNTLLFDSDELAGQAVEPIVNAEVKAHQVKEWQAELGIGSNEIMVVGDGANDSKMMEVAGLGVAYKAKPLLRQKADCVIQYGEMNGLIDILKVVLRFRA
ncbi:hypothetical protein GCM10023150_02360 [Kangiella taiwanensis]|uniref:Phosphoserine phosphatase n=1 Tax=Kangiella taiwanensis TaxID=1079179 RepID=A0ABP8HSE5_9GAMM